MNSTSFAALFIFSFLLFASGNHARKNPEEYWRDVMKDQPMPDAIKDLISRAGIETNKDFVRDIDVKPNAIIYHGRDMDEATTKEEDGFLERVNVVGDDRDQMMKPSLV